jgi:putative acetyltransferase
MLRQLAIDDMDSAAVVLRMSFDEAFPDLTGLHTPDEDRWFFRERMFATCQLWGYFDGKELVGFIAFREGWIDQLYVLPSSQGRGIGTALLQVAQSKSGHLSLWTFLRNKNARRFYEKHGFVLVKETDGARNEEKEPDAMYSWRLNGTLKTEALPGPVPDVIALRPFVSAKDFEKSLSFFADLGFRAYRLGDQLASMHIGPFAFLLQARPNDDERFAANFMMHMLVEDIDTWWSRIATLDLAKALWRESSKCTEASAMGSRRSLYLGSVGRALAYR